MSSIAGEIKRPVWAAALFSYQRRMQILILVAVLTAWEWYGRRVGDFFLAPPSSVAVATVELLRTGELLRALLDSISGLLIGYGLAVIVGIALGYLMGWYRTLGAILDPFISAIYVVPVASLVPVLIVWFGIGMVPRVLAVFLFCVFEIIINTYTGVRNTDPLLIEVARSFGAKQRQLFTKVVFQNSIPFIFAGLRVSVGRALKGMVVAELLFAVTGLGGLIMVYSNYYKTAKVFVIVIVLALLGVILAGLIQWIQRILAPWSR